MDLLPYEKKHIEYLEKNAQEGTLFLKRNSVFPLSKPCKLVLVGNGARNTIKGGTGSGDVASRFFVNAYDGFKNKGFEIASIKWMDEYDEFLKSTDKEYIKDTKRASRKYGILPMIFSMGFFDYERNYNFNLNYEGDACIYVLSRNSGEGNDRRNIKGDAKLSDKEVEDILYLNNKFNKFLLVLNVGGVIDLSPILEVNNILLLSQLGVVTGTVLADIVLGNLNPSGKLATTWAKPENYPYFDEFGNPDDTYYKEGIFVGYRYFDTFKKDTFFNFGYGLSYTTFDIRYKSITIDKTLVKVKANVKNTGDYPGKEVVMVYLSKPTTELDEPNQVLCAYTKTDELRPQEELEVELVFDLSNVASYDEKTASYKLYKGNYIVRLGNDVSKTQKICVLSLLETITTKQLENKVTNKDKTFEELKLNVDIDRDITGLEVITINNSNFKTDVIEYKKDTYVDPLIETLSDKELALMVVGNHGYGISAIIGNSCREVVGGAGQTTLAIPKITKSLTMADGPAGLRLKQTYGVDKKGVYDISIDPMFEKMSKFLPRIAKPFIMPPKNRHGVIHNQFTTALPIGTSIAQSFNNKYAEELGNIVAEEMDIFDVDLWLAPALNIHRNILCGRNFEYYSEDPLVSGLIAASITKGVQSLKGRGVTIKHFACNNQELNRNNNNSHLSERALREIYLKGFEICIKESSPKALMTSYNLINGVHSSESYELINDILRCEWGYQGLVMTDWIASGRSFCRKSIYPAPYASNNVKVGNDLTMPGCKGDEKDILKALKKHKLTKEDLVYSASRIYRSINEQKK